VDEDSRMRIVFECEKLDVVFNRQSLKFALLGISRIALTTVTASVADPKMTVSFTVRQLECEDLLARSEKWRMICRTPTPRDDNVLFRMASYQKGTKIHPGHDFDIFLRIGAVEFVYLHKFTMDLIDFLMEFVEMRTVVFKER